MSVTRRIAKYQPDVELFGDWQRCERLFLGIDNSIRLGSRAGQKSAAKRLLRIVRKNIRENGGSIGWPSLSESYQKRKAASGYSPNRMLYMTGLYYRSIMIWDRGGRYYVGVKPRIYNPKSGGHLTVGKIARILEHGSHIMNLPARPLWRPSFRQMGGNRKVKALILWHVRNQIKKDFQVTATVKI